MTLFVANCQALRPKPRISYLFTSYLCWGSSALILWTGESGLLGKKGRGLGKKGRGLRKKGRAGEKPGLGLGPRWW